MSVQIGEFFHAEVDGLARKGYVLGLCEEGSDRLEFGDAEVVFVDKWLSDRIENTTFAVAEEALERAVFPWEGSPEAIESDWKVAGGSPLSHLWRQQEGEVQVEIKWMLWRSPSGREEIVRTCMIPPTPIAVLSVGNGRLKPKCSDRVYIPHSRWSSEIKAICRERNEEYESLKRTPEWAAFEMQQAEDQRRDGGGSTSVDSDGVWNK
jgi:hypothetical protein